VVDIVRTDARRGVTPAKKIADMCAGFHMNCELHSWGSIIGQAANLHVMAAIQNCEFFEQAVPLERFEVCAKDHFSIDSEGYVHVPVRPGMGVELDWDEIDKRTVYRT
jgi:L-alanine-DL-glutamate epimerase-like enolase superfamily enzyme